VGFGLKNVEKTSFFRIPSEIGLQRHNLGQNTPEGLPLPPKCPGISLISAVFWV
jgi:hypothetical protein